MTTLFNFIPTAQAPFQFSPVLDGVTYQVFVTWNLFGQRYYVNVYDDNQDLVASVPLIGSSSGLTMEEVYWDHGRAFVVTSAPHGFEVNSLVRVKYSGVVPDAYNGVFDSIVVDEDTLSYALTADPGEETSLGTVFYDINLVGGYFSSTLVYRQANGQFEVRP